MGQPARSTKPIEGIDMRKLSEKTLKRYTGRQICRHFERLQDRLIADEKLNSWRYRFNFETGQLLQFTPSFNAYFFAANMWDHEAVRWQYEKFCKANEITTRGILPDLEVELDPTLAEISPGVIR